MIKTFYALDFDRCIGNIEAVTQLLDLAVKAAGIDMAAMERSRTAIESSGGSFDVADWIRQRCTEAEYTAFIRNYLELPFDETALLEPGAGAFVARLGVSNLPFGIITYGGEVWQRTKLQRAGFGDVPTLITSSKEKGREIAWWQRPNRPGFWVPAELSGSGKPIIAEEIVLIDDKAAAFVGLPERARGYMIQHGAGLQPSQRGEVPPRVLCVGSFREIPLDSGSSPE